jgi:hypothetical protein
MSLSSSVRRNTGHLEDHSPLVDIKQQPFIKVQMSSITLYLNDYLSIYHDVQQPDDRSRVLGCLQALVNPAILPP